MTYQMNFEHLLTYDLGSPVLNIEVTFEVA